MTVEFGEYMIFSAKRYGATWKWCEFCGKPTLIGKLDYPEGHPRDLACEECRGEKPD